MALNDSPLFLRTLGKSTGPGFPDAAPRTRLREALFRFRERAALLAGEIHRDLPDFTVHDITHLDALWEMADLIAGPDYPLNPLEAFTLGGVFLLHDVGLGLAAYPGGRQEIQQGLGWQDALSSHLRKRLERAPTPEELASPPPEIERAAILERLRNLHAERAEKLALASWGNGTYHLIEDPDLRLTLGPLLGRIAHSHWWPVSRLANEFGTVVGALPDCSGDWTLDPLKIAILLRTADAAHLDARRAPGFLRALRRPEGISQDHWRFQEHLLKPRVEDDRLVYTTARPFTPDEVDAWWLCEETLRMVDGELHQSDALLADLHRQRLRARGVAGVESPLRLMQFVKVSGWTPVDARIHVSNVASLARHLGGENLYGNNPHVPLRELIQNASDAIRARRLLEDRPENWGQITVRVGRDDQGEWLEVEDTGIGMSEAVLTGPLLDFGTTYWGSALMRDEHEGLWAKGFEPTGRFGIGFFSVFMWGHRVRVTSRRYEDAQRDTRVLEFRTGIETRPFLRSARTEEQLRDGGTRIRVWLNCELCDLWLNGGLRDLGALCAWLAPALDVDLYTEDEGNRRLVVTASDWVTMATSKLIKRLRPNDLTPRGFNPRLSLILDSSGKTLGRAALYPGLIYHSAGVVTIGGLRSKSTESSIAGILLGSASRASRDSADILADTSSLSSWASEQAKLIAERIRDPLIRLHCSASVIRYGGHPGSLPIVQYGDEYLDLKALAQLKNAPEEVAIVELDEDYEEYLHLIHPHPLLIARSGFNPSDANATKATKAAVNLIRDSLSVAWHCPAEDISIENDFYEFESGRWDQFAYINFTVLRKPTNI